MIMEMKVVLAPAAERKEGLAADWLSEDVSAGAGSSQPTTIIKTFKFLINLFY